MPIIVQKFGGTSVADSDKILAAARKAIRAQTKATRWWWSSAPWASTPTG